MATTSGAKVILTIHCSIFPGCNGRILADHLAKFFMKGYSAETLLHKDLAESTEKWELLDDGSFRIQYNLEDIKAIASATATPMLCQHDWVMYFKKNFSEYLANVVSGNSIAIAHQIAVSFK